MRWPWTRTKADPQPDAKPVAAPRPTDWSTLVARARQPRALKAVPTAPAKLHPAGVAPSAIMASDDALTSDYSAWAGTTIDTLFAEGQAFLGYPLLAELAQRPEYRRIVETLARHMTRKWIEFQSAGEDEQDKEEEDSEVAEDGDLLPFGQVKEEGGEEEPSPELAEVKKAKQDKADKINKIEAELIRLDAREVFQRICAQDGFFGRAHLYVDLGTTEDLDELKTTIGNGEDDATKAKLANKGEKAIVALRPVEAVWCYPTNYNSNDPLRPDWYRPSEWFVMGKQIHASRLLPFVGHEVPDLLKPAYSFGGLSMTQMVRPYVDNWLNTRQSVSDLVSAFSQMVLLTNLTEALNAGNGDQLFDRVDFFNAMRDNRGTMVADKKDEDFKNVSTPLGTLDKLQAQSQEQMASIAGIPIVLLLMITPAGLNASSEGEIQAFYDWINASQEKFIRPHLTTIINMIQISLFGDVDPDITFTFAPLWGLNELEEAQRDLAIAQTDSAYTAAGILNAEEVRERLSNDAASPYHGIDVSDVPEPPMPEGGLFGEEGDEGEDGKPGEPGAPAKKAA